MQPEYPYSALATSPAQDGDPTFDEIGSQLKIKEMQHDEKKQELFTQLSLYYRVFFLGEEIE